MKNENSQSEDVPPDSERAKLLAVLQKFNISTESFDSLRCDSYEKHIAKRSVEELDSVYYTLLQPGAGYEEMRGKFPRWGADTKYDGNLPANSTLCTIKHRIMAEQTANDLDRFSRHMESLSNRLTSLPSAKQTEVFEVILSLIGEELVRDKFDGKRLLQNLPALDRLLKASAIKFRERQGEKRNELREQELNLKKNQPPIKPTAVPPTPPTKPAVKLTGSEKTDAMIERIYGIKF
jgi:hypothetical protein